MFSSNSSRCPALSSLALAWKNFTSLVPWCWQIAWLTCLGSFSCSAFSRPRAMWEMITLALSRGVSCPCGSSYTDWFSVKNWGLSILPRSWYSAMARTSSGDSSSSWAAASASEATICEWW